VIRFPHLVFVTLILLSACKPAVTPTTLPTEMTTATASISPLGSPGRSTAIPGSRTITIFAAASLTNAFIEIGLGFEAANPGSKVVFNFAGSQTLSTQLTQGAVADVFASANPTEMEKLVTSGLVQKDSPMDFLTNQLVVILPTNNPANITTLDDLTRKGLKLVLASDTVPVGKYTLQVLEKLDQDPSFGTDFKTRILNNVVSYENDVKLVVAKVQLGEADAGFVYISDSVASPELKFVKIPSKFNIIAEYPIAALINAPQPDLAERFIAYVLSFEGQAILKKWGFTPITQPG